MGSSDEDEEAVKTHNDSTTAQNKNENSSPRILIGNSINTVSDVINDNIIIARYTCFSTIALLTAYGMFKTPLFHRYKSISEIPSTHFSNRKTIHGRIVHVAENTYSTNHEKGTEQPIVCLIRQLSPVGRLLNKASFNYMVNVNPSSQVVDSKGDLRNAKDLLKVEIAGIKQPPFYYNQGQEGVNDWINTLASKHTRVSCTLLSRRIEKPKVQQDGSLDHESISLSNDKQERGVRESISGEQEQTAIAKITYRPGASIFRTDLASSLLQHGRANTAAGLHVEMPSHRTIDGSTNLGDMEADVKYLENLAQKEFEAVKRKKGMWQNEDIRESRQDLVKEADFEENATIFQKLWRRLKGD